jgi:hypothetical protein
MSAINALGQGGIVPGGLVTPRRELGQQSVMDAMGQSLFAPPNVKGWEGGLNWLNTATILARDNFSEFLCNKSGQLNLGSPGATVGIQVDPSAIVRREKLTDPKEIVALIVDLLLDGEIEAGQRERLVNFIAEDSPKDGALDQRVRNAMHAVMTMPEYQLS